LSDLFLIQNGLKECFIATTFHFCFRMRHQEGPKKSSGNGTECNTRALSLFRQYYLLGKKIPRRM